MAVTGASVPCSPDLTNEGGGWLDMPIPFPPEKKVTKTNACEIQLFCSFGSLDAFSLVPYLENRVNVYLGSTIREPLCGHET